MRQTLVKHRRGTTAEWQQYDLIIKDGEIVIEECLDGSHILKIGDGKHKYSELPSFTQKIIVKDLILTSASGKNFRVIVDDQGKLNSQEI